MISDDSTADQTLNKALFSAEEALNSFKDCKINDLLCSFLYFEPILINIHPEKPQNLDINKHWHSIGLFKLFFNWKTMSIIIKETNSYAFQINTAKNLWKTLEIHELYHFFECLIHLELFKHSSRVYSWGSNDILAQVSLLKNHFESILSNFHFKDHGLNSI